MDLVKFESLMRTFQRKELGQDPHEWRNYLEFVSSYFATRKIDRPVIVEIGIWNGLQRRFYEGLLNAEYIGIDNGNPFAPITVGGKDSIPDILGDSHDLGTVEKLKVLLGGRLIDLLFIDGDHSYESVSLDYQLYEPFVKYLVVFHDMIGTDGVIRFWGELVEKERNRPYVIFKKDSSADWVLQMGIGVMVKGE